MASLSGAGSFPTTAGVSGFDPPGAPWPVAAAGSRSTRSSHILAPLQNCLDAHYGGGTTAGTSPLY